MDGDFDIEVDDQTAPDYEISDNIAENLVDVIRSDMVGNEAQFLALNAAYTSGLSRVASEYLQIIVRGKSGEGKTELKQNVDTLYPDHWLLRAGSTSDMGLVDSGDVWDGAFVGAFAEFQQMQGKMLEMVKSSAGDDANEEGVGFSHIRNVDDGDGGRTEDEIEKQAMPTVFLFADENNAEIPRELETRQMVIRVESDERINRAVAKTKFDHTEVEVADRDYEYNFNFDDGKAAVQNHISNIPRNMDPLWGEDPKTYAYPVVIPHDEDVEWPINDHPSVGAAGWDVFNVVEPILSYKKTESKRGAQAIANHIRSWARLNYHNRETMDINGVTHYVAEPQDVATVLAYRDLLLAATHDMDEQKLAIIEALTNEEKGVGGPGPNGGLQATEKDIASYIDEHADITALSSHQLHNNQSGGVLDEMADDYLIEIHENEGENGAHLYEFLGGSTFGHPNLDAYGDLFSECTDPIRDQPIRETVENFKQSLSTVTTEDLMAEDDLFEDDSDGDTRVQPTTGTESDEQSESGGLSAFSDDGDDSDSEWSELHESVHTRLQDTLDDARVEEDHGMETQHMVGISPTEYYTDDRGMQYIRADAPSSDDHKVGTIMDPDHALWGDVSDGQVTSKVNAVIQDFRSEGVFEVHADEDNDGHKYFIIRDLDT